MLFLSIGDSYAQQDSVLFNFNNIDGNIPVGGLTSVGNYLYGVTNEGGVYNNGVVFKVKPNGTNFDTLFSAFKGKNGYYPLGSLIYFGGYLYGVNTEGGIHNNGVLFKIDTDGTGFDTLYSFNNTTMGVGPDGSLFYDGTYFYGMTQLGGLYGDGVIYKIKPDGTNYDTLLSFNGINGEYPFGSLFYDGTYLYGMANEGAPYNDGNIFKIKPDGTGFDTLLSFNGTNGEYPDGELISDGTYLYGITPRGGVQNNGFIFKIKPNGTGFDTMHSFNGTNILPGFKLTFDGTYLYGVTHYGGIYNDGIIYRIKSDGTNFDTLLSFNQTNGETPDGILTLVGNSLYGMTGYGGTNYNGVIFRIDTNLITSVNSLKPAKTAINLYPNPNNGVFTVQSSISSQQYSVEIYNILGELVYSKPNIQNPTFNIDISSQVNGVYLYRLTAINGELIDDGKLIIQK